MLGRDDDQVNRTDQRSHRRRPCGRRGIDDQQPLEHHSVFIRRNEADVVCTQLGLGHAVGYGTRHAFTGAADGRPTWMSGVRCTNREVVGLESCNFNDGQDQWSGKINYQCVRSSHYYDVGVTCSLQPPYSRA